MTRLRYAFTDVVSGEAVWYWKDHFGFVWMASEGDWFFRVRCEEEQG